MATRKYDIVIVGASFGGVAAALAAARTSDKRIALIEASNHVGGQATAQGVTRWDESQYVISPTSFGSSKSYRGLKDAIRDWYRRNAKLKTAADRADFNPGSAAKGRAFAADPAVVERVILEQLDVFKPQLQLLLGRTVTKADVRGGVIHSLTVRSKNAEDEFVAQYYLDATDLGDLLPLCNVKWFIGAESQKDTQEPKAEPSPNRRHIQPITVPIALELRPESEKHVIPRPGNYNKTLIKEQGFAIKGDRNGLIDGMFRGEETLWGYRRYIDRQNFRDPEYACDRSTMNVGSNDYQNGVIPTGDSAKDAAIVEDARAVSLAYVYYLQTEAPRDDGKGRGYPNLMIRKDAFGTKDGTATAAYIRESRRIAAPVTRVLQQHIAGSGDGAVRAPMNFSDSCGVVYYGIDVHEIYKPGGTPWVGGITVQPFQLPLGALIPTDVSNLIASCKNIGATHLTSGAYRVHPGEWAVGEAAGMLAVYCVGQNVTPAQAHANPARVASFQLRLLEQGVPIFWWDDVVFEADPQVFAAAHLMGVRGLLGDAGSLHFRPNETLAHATRDAVNSHVGKHLPWPSTPLKRARAAVWLCAELGMPSNDVVRHWTVTT